MIGESGGVLANQEFPAPKFSMMIDGAYPATGGNLFLSVLLPFKALHLQDDFELATIFAAPANEIVRAILVSHALPFIGDGEVEMVVAGIGDHFR